MAQFQGGAFNFANDNSINYDVYILEFGPLRGLETASAGGNMSVVSDSVSRRAENFVYGVRQDNNQQFNVVIGSDTEKSRADIDRILGWLLKPTVQYLHIRQNDMDFYRYKGYFTNPQVISVAKRLFGLQLTFVSTSPYAYTFPQSKEWTITQPKTVIFNNTGDSLAYLFPTISITPNNITQSFSIINVSDNNREFRFDFAAPFPNGNEIITIDNDLQIITSSMGNDFGRRRFNQFNMKYLRFIRGKNVLNIVGNGRIELSYSFPRRIGA